MTIKLPSNIPQLSSFTLFHTRNNTAYIHLLHISFTEYTKYVVLFIPGLFQAKNKSIVHTEYIIVVSLLGILVISPALTKAQEDSPSPPTPHDHNGYSPSMATLFIVIIGLLFTVAFVSIYLKHFAWCLGLDIGGPGQARGPWGRPMAHGLDPRVVESFPTFIYSDVKQHRIGKSSLECAVCLNRFADDEVLRVLPGCCHVFHPHCIRPWLACHVTCPLCRENLELHQVDPTIDSLITTDDQPEPSDHGQGQSQTPPPQDRRTVKSPEVIRSPLQHIKDGLARIGRLPRSHSTGSHSLDSERSTLRLPDDAHLQLVNPDVSPLRAMVSPRTGFRTRSSGLVIKPDRWRFSVSPPFFNRTGPVLSPRFDGVVDSGSRNVVKSVKSPLNRMVRESDIGERSSDRLWPDRSVQDMDLENQR